MSGEKKSGKGIDGFPTRHGKLITNLRKYFPKTPIEDIEDATQDAYYEALRNSKIDFISDPGADGWIFRAAYNRMVNKINRMQRFPFVRYLEDEHTTREHDFLKDLNLSLIMDLFLEECGEKTAKVIGLLTKGFKPAEIAAELGIKTESVYKIIQRCREYIRKRLDLPPPTTSVPNESCRNVSCRAPTRNVKFHSISMAFVRFLKKYFRAMSNYALPDCYIKYKVVFCLLNAFHSK